MYAPISHTNTVLDPLNTTAPRFCIDKTKLYAYITEARWRKSIYIQGWDGAGVSYRGTRDRRSESRARS
jgi:hypothetical protein